MHDALAGDQCILIVEKRVCLPTAGSAQRQRHGSGVRATGHGLGTSILAFRFL